MHEKGLHIDIIKYYIKGWKRKMKKLFAILLCACMMLAVVSCGTPAEKAKEAEYKLGMGVVVSMASSKTGLAQVDATVATVVTDANGKIVACRIDVAQNKMTVTDGAVDAAATFETKMELGDRYGMAGKVDNDGNGVMKEWYEQTKAFEAWTVGKTADEIKNMETQEAGGHVIAVDKALLEAGCSMQITDFRDAVVAACNDEQGMTFKTAAKFTLGVAASTSAADSKAATAEENGLVAMYSDFAATVVADGKIIAALNDAIQPKITIDAAGEIVETAYVNTKRNLKEAYNMAAYGQSMDWNGDGKVLEWYVQSLAFSNYVVGKTGAEVKAMTTKAAASEGAGAGYQISTDDALLSAGCTIQITAIKDVMAKAVNNAR